MWLAITGTSSGKRSLPRSQRWKAADEAAGDHIGRAAGSAKPRSAEGPEDGERQQVPPVPCHEGAWKFCQL